MRMNVPFLRLFFIVFLFSLSLVLTFGSGTASVGESRPWLVAADTRTVASADVPTSIEEIQRITPKELKRLLDVKSDVIVVDNQPKSAYDMGHIKGAVNLPWGADIEEDDIWQLPQGKVLILYCACTHEEDAGDVALQLIKKFGYKNIRLLQGGWIEWEKLGYPIEKAKGK